MSDVCCLMSHVKRLIFFVDVRHLMSRVRHDSDVCYMVSDVRRLMSDI